MNKISPKNSGSGYGKPPEEHKWKKGQSGNPTGRKKEAEPHLRIAELIAEELRRRVPVNENGKQVQITCAQLLARQLVVSGIKGKPKDIAIVMAQLSKLGVFEDEEMLEEENDVFSEEDRRLIEIARQESSRE